MSDLQPPPDGDVDRSASLIALTWAPYPFMLAIVIARVVVRFERRNFGVDDGLMVTALVRIPHCQLVILQSPRDSHLDSCYTLADLYL